MNITRCAAVAAVFTAMCTTPALAAKETAKETGKTAASKTVTTTSGLKIGRAHV